MSLLWVDGFDHYAASGALATVVGVVGGAYSAVWATDATIATMPITGGLGLRMVGSNSDPTAAIEKPLPTTYGSGTTLGVGSHFILDSAAYADAGRGLDVFHFKNGIGTSTVMLCVLQGGQLTIRYDNVVNADSGNSGANVLSLDVVYHIELKVFLHATLGTIEVRVNGATWITMTNQNTLRSTTYTSCGVGQANLSSGQGFSAYWDNFFIWDGAGSINNDFIGECTVLTLFPSADTADADWTLSTGASGFDLINDVPAAGTTRYLEAAAAADLSVFDLTNLPTTNYNIKGVQTVVNAQKTTSGATTIEIGVETNSVQDLSAPLTLTENAYLYKHHITQQNPDTLAAWTPTEINALQIVLDRAA
jgi:hypothetical protein